MQVLLTTCGAWHLRNTARAFEARNALAALWCTERNRNGIAPSRYRRCWPFHLAMAPFYLSDAQQIWRERAFYNFFPVWRHWQRRQPWPQCQVVHSIIGYATEAFDQAEKHDALKVLDCPNSHPVSYYGFWQRECDIFCPGEKVPVPRWMFGRMTRELERADAIIVQSRFCQESMVHNGIPPHKIVINPMGVDRSIFQPRELPPARTRFVDVGTICLRKGHQYLFPAFQIVKKQLPDAELVCVGRYKCDFRKQRARWSGTFTHYPQLPQREVAALLRTATAFVFPSQEEGIGRAQVEALACGVPVIGTHEAGTTTLVDDGVEGFIVRGRDPQHIAEAMLKTATNLDLNRQMGNAAIKKGAEANTWQDYGDRLLAEYARRLDQKRN